MPSTRRSQTQELKERTLANRYKMLRKLGSGNFGTVFVVEDLKSDEKWLALMLSLCLLCFHINSSDIPRRTYFLLCGFDIYEQGYMK